MKPTIINNGEKTSKKNDILSLCIKVMTTSLIFWDNPNGGYDHTCPFCGVTVSVGGNESFPSIKDLKHDPDCVYLLAKDISTGLL